MSAEIAVETVTPEGLLDVRPAWNDLLQRCDEPNVFMDPVLVCAAAEAYPGAPCWALLAWTKHDMPRRLLGVWVFAARTASHSVAPVQVLEAPAFAHGYASAPVIDRACLHEVFTAMLDRIASDPRLPKFVVLRTMTTGTAAMRALRRVLADRRTAPALFESAHRPRLESELDGPSYLARSLSAATRKRLRQKRRRLAEQGTIDSAEIKDPQAVRDALEEFLRLEAAGWKGHRGTALLCSPADAAFTRAAIGGLADQGAASIHALAVEHHSISMQIILRAGHAAFTWKIAYDEKWGKYSPGMQLVEDCTAALLADPQIEYVDSCADDDSGLLSVWTEREAIATVWFDARRNGSAAFELLWRVQKVYSGLRRTAKGLYHAARRKPVRSGEP